MAGVHYNSPVGQDNWGRPGMGLITAFRYSPRGAEADYFSFSLIVFILELGLAFKVGKRKKKIPHTGDTNSLDRCG